MSRDTDIGMVGPEEILALRRVLETEQDMEVRNNIEAVFFALEMPGLDVITLIQTLANPDTSFPMQMNALNELINRDVGPEFIPMLIQILEQDNNDCIVRCRVGHALIRRWTGTEDIPTLVPVFARILEEDRDQSVRAMTVIELAEMGSPEVIPALRRALATEQDPYVIEAIRTALGRIE